MTVRNQAINQPSTSLEQFLLTARADHCDDADIHSQVTVHSKETKIVLAGHRVYYALGPLTPANCTQPDSMQAAAAVVMTVRLQILDQPFRLQAAHEACGWAQDASSRKLGAAVARWCLAHTRSSGGTSTQPCTVRHRSSHQGEAQNRHM
jgi:hypothetical protein